MLRHPKAKPHRKMAGNVTDTSALLGYHARGHYPLTYTIMQKMAAGRDGRRARPLQITSSNSISFGVGACAALRNRRLDPPRLGIALFKLEIFDTHAIQLTPNHSFKLNVLWPFQLEIQLL